MSTATKSQCAILRDAIKDKPPFTSGTMVLPEESFTLYFGKDKTARRVDLAAAPDEELEYLSKACDPATFGVNQRDVLDESYRKAGKLDSADFASKFTIEKTDLMKTIRPALLEGHDELKPVRAELYKLNVYGQGSFFKAHKDTPRDDRMFGSLVIVFPMPHSGGELVFRHRGKEWTVDTAKAALSQSSPSITYVAFYSDIEHEVMLVKSGYRVTMTYNLYFGVMEIPLTPSIQPNELALKTALTELLSDPTFLPKGGNLGFGLLYQYPIDTETGSLKGLVDSLKGSDAIIRRACKELSLDASLRALYKTERALVMVDRIADFGDMQVDSRTAELRRRMGGSFIEIYEEEEPAGCGYDTDEGYMWSDKYRLRVHEQVSWVTAKTDLNRTPTSYVAYGNEASMATTYGDVCLIVRVGAPGQRETFVE